MGTMVTGSDDLPLASGTRSAASDGVDAAGFPPERQGWYAVSVIAVVTTFALLDQGIIGLLIQQIKTDFALTDTEAGLLLGPAFVIFYAFLGLPLSRYVDRANRTIIMSIGIFVWSIATAACSLASSFIALFLSRIMVGAGESINGPASYSIISDYFPRDKLPRAIATAQIGSVAGGGLSMLIGGSMIWIIANVGNPDLPIVGTLRPWQVVFLAVGLPGILVSLLMLTVKEPPRHGLRMDRPKVGFWKAMGYLWANFALFGPMFIGLTVGSLDQGSRAWGAAFFERTYGWSPAQYGFTSGILSIILMLSGLYIGTKAVESMQKRGYDDAPMRLVIYCRLAAMPFAILMPLMPSPWLALAFSGVGMLTLGMSGPSLNAVLQIVSPNEIRGQVTALYLFIFFVVGSGLSPFVTGVVTDYVFTSPDDLRWSIMLLHVIFLPASLIITWLGWKPYRDEVRRLKAIDPQRA
ncbi:MAG TPA: MFS transporter [Sphingomonadaceae bacterium]|nr:MFS transporter [Sphingomonadaceae bacterium]